jgi:hypothetical protein
VVAQLEEPYREQVIRAYEASLRLTFGFTIFMSLVSIALVVPMKLNRLPARRVKKTGIN